jgi:hypothetical protein
MLALASCALCSRQNGPDAGQPISWDNSITQIRFGCNIHQLSQLVNILLALNTAGSAAHLPNDSQPTPSRPP